MPDQLNPEDIIAALIRQRNDALNRLAQVEAALTELQRKTEPAPPDLQVVPPVGGTD